jgi:hypothetical protein
MEDVNDLKLYHAQMEGFTGSSDHFFVANSEDQARDIIYNMYGGKSGGYRKNQIGVCEIEVEGYVIQVKPKLLEIFQKEVPGFGFETYKIILPNGKEIVNPYKNRVMNVEALNPHVGERILLHVYNGEEFRFKEEVTLLPSMETPFGGYNPHFKYDEE